MYGNGGVLVLKAFETWLDIRSGEMRKVFLCVLGAFLLMAFVTLARSMREGLFLAVFDAKKLPYVMAAVACLSLPAVGLFAGLLGRYSTWIVLRRLLLIFGIGLGALWAASQYIFVVAVVFYVWTVLGTLLLTSGFWILITGNFPLRSARRLFGLIAAGGTAGVMAMGLSLSRIIPKLQLVHIIPFLIGILFLFYLIAYGIHRLPHSNLFPGNGRNKFDGDKGMDDFKDKGRNAPTGLFNIPGNVRIILNSPHLRSISAIVFVATVASSIVDYQFKEFAQTNIGNGEELAGFFGTFYGYVGGIALLVQLLFTARMMTSMGVALGLAALPGALLLGSTGFLLLPGLIMATVVRGADNTLRKSLLRPMLEFLYVPVPELIRRRTKTFIDSFVDSIAEGFGALVIYAWVVLGGGLSRYLSLMVILLSLGLLFLSRRAGKRYFETIVHRLKEETPEAGKAELSACIKTNLYKSGFSEMDTLTVIVGMRNISGIAVREVTGFTTGQRDHIRETELGSRSEEKRDISTILQSSDAHGIVSALNHVKEWNPDQIPLLIRLLARDNLRVPAVKSLLRAGFPAVPYLAASLLDEDEDFVIRRRIPKILAGIGGEDAESALLRALSAGRFEIRYRVVLALVELKKKKLCVPEDQLETTIWEAIRKEVHNSRPVWEMRRLLDSIDSGEDDGLVAKRVRTRTNLSMEHTFRMLTLVLDPKPVAAALNGILVGDEEIKSLALEYMERTLPADIWERLWLFVGDASESRKAKETRPLNQVVNDLMSSQITLFQRGRSRIALKKIKKNLQG